MSVMVLVENGVEALEGKERILYGDMWYDDDVPIGDIVTFPGLLNGSKGGRDEDFGNINWTCWLPYTLWTLSSWPAASECEQPDERLDAFHWMHRVAALLSEPIDYEIARSTYTIDALKLLNDFVPHDYALRIAELLEARKASGGRGYGERIIDLLIDAYRLYAPARAQYTKAREERTYGVSGGLVYVAAGLCHLQPDLITDGNLIGAWHRPEVEAAKRNGMRIPEGVEKFSDAEMDRVAGHYVGEMRKAMLNALRQGLSSGETLTDSRPTEKCDVSGFCDECVQQSLVDLCSDLSEKDRLRVRSKIEKAELRVFEI